MAKERKAADQGAAEGNTKELVEGKIGGMIGEMEEANRALHMARAEYQATKEVCKERRGELDAAQNRVNGLVDQLTGHEAAEMPLFENGKTEEGSAKTQADDGEDWRQVLLSSFRGEMSLPQALLATLAKANILTVGGLADWTAEDRTLTMIEGIGPAGAEKIEKAMLRFWELRKAGARD